MMYVAHDTFTRDLQHMTAGAGTGQTAEPVVRTGWAMPKKQPHVRVRPVAGGHISAMPSQQQAGRAVAASGRQQRGRRPVVRLAKPASTLALAGRAER